jgi:hypothetical protein
LVKGHGLWLIVYNDDSAKDDVDEDTNDDDNNDENYDDYDYGNDDVNYNENRGLGMHAKIVLVLAQMGQNYIKP